MKVAFIDGDILCYKAGFACQESTVKAYVEGKYMGEFKSRTEFLSCMDFDSHSEYDITYEDVVKAEPLSNAFAVVNSMVKSIMRRAGCQKYVIYIDGEGNFRESVATIRPYKGNRKQAKPLHFKAIKKYIINKLKGKEITGIEADDALSIVQYMSYSKKKPWVVCTIDKDARNTPGYLFNFDKDEQPVYIGKMEAYRNFFKQLLTGDTVDNIVGCRGIGKSNKALAEIDNCKSTTEMFEVVADCYLRAATNRGLQVKFETTDVVTVEDELLENGILLWMMRSKDEVPWHPVIHCGVDEAVYEDFVSKSEELYKKLSEESSKG